MNTIMRNYERETFTLFRACICHVVYDSNLNREQKKMRKNSVAFQNKNLSYKNSFWPSAGFYVSKNNSKNQQILVKQREKERNAIW